MHYLPSVDELGMNSVDELGMNSESSTAISRLQLRQSVIEVVSRSISTRFTTVCAMKSLAC
jgi:hypothetical protein